MHCIVVYSTQHSILCCILYVLTAVLDDLAILSIPNRFITQCIFILHRKSSMVVWYAESNLSFSCYVYLFVSLPLPPPFIKQIKSLLVFKISVKGHGPLSGKQNTVQSHVYWLDYSLPPPP